MSETFFGGTPVQVAETGTDADNDVALVTSPEAGEAATAGPATVVPDPGAAAPIALQSDEIPSFALVRVEPDGSAVIAGIASPDGAVEIFADAEVIGAETATQSGDWAFVTAEPLPAGGIELRVRDVETDRYSTTSVLVVIEDDRAGEPLVVALEPGEASEILQGLQSAPASQPLDVAQAPVAGDAAPADPEIPETDEPEAGTLEGTAEEPTLVADAPLAIDAVEIDGTRNFFAGSGVEGLSVQLYVDNVAVGTGAVSDGRWLIETDDVLAGSSQRVRADLIDPEGNVVGRAEVDFLLDLPTTVAGGETQATPGAGTVPVMVGVTEGDVTRSGMAIIRRGDNLWTIASRVYGDGFRYTHIFEANTDQIRNPDLIYPGQVFALPGTDAVLGEEEA